MSETYHLFPGHATPYRASNLSPQSDVLGIDIEEQEPSEERKEDLIVVELDDSPYDTSVRSCRDNRDDAESRSKSDGIPQQTAAQLPAQAQQIQQSRDNDRAEFAEGLDRLQEHFEQQLKGAENSNMFRIEEVKAVVVAKLQMLSTPITLIVAYLQSMMRGRDVQNS